MNTTTIEVILGLTPIKYYLQNKALNTVARLKCCNDWTDTQGSTEKMYSKSIINICARKQNTHKPTQG